ncbi:MAG: hypothetical protein ACPIOQ_34075, partial [Promethearchaeia archaeon]
MRGGVRRAPSRPPEREAERGDDMVIADAVHSALVMASACWLKGSSSSSCRGVSFIARRWRRRPR